MGNGEKTLEVDNGNQPMASAPGRGSEKGTILYLILAFFLLLATLFYSFIIPQTPGRLTRVSVTLIPELPIWSFIAALPIPVPASRWTVAAALVFSAGIAFAAYGLATLISWKRAEERGVVVLIAAAAVIFSVVSAFSFPNTSTDIFNYMANGRIAAVYNSNPYQVAADAFPDDPVYPYASKNYTGLPADKMPFWILINVMLAELTGEDVVANLFIYRTALLVFNMANLLLVGLIAYRLNPLFLSSALIIYGWNPVVIVHAQAKSDTLMALMLLLAMLLFMVGRRLIAVGALALSFMVKLVTLPLLGVYMIGNLRLRRWRAFIIDSLIFIFLPLLAYLFVWHSPQLTMRFLGLLTVAGAAAPGVFQIVLIAGFCVLILFTGFMQDGSMSRLIWGWSLVMLYFSFFLTKFGLAWYLITLLALASLVFDWRIVLATGALSFTSFFYNGWYTTFTQSFPVPDLVSIAPFWVYILLSGFIVAGGLSAAFIAHKLSIWPTATVDHVDES